MHHPFTSPKPEDIEKLDTDPANVRANAYDLVLNGNEIGGGSIRIHNRDLQKLMFKHLGFSDEEAKEQFGFLMEAFEYGAHLMEVSLSDLTGFVLLWEDKKILEILLLSQKIIRVEI